MFRSVFLVLALLTSIVASDVLIADQFNNRIIQVTHDANPKIVWTYGTGSSDATKPNSCVAPNDALRLNGGKTLISCTGAPEGSEDTCPDGCPDNRVLISYALSNNPRRNTTFYGTAGQTGSDTGFLSAPVHATNIHRSRAILITDQGNQRILRGRGCNFNPIYGQTGVAGSGHNQLNSPNSAILFAENRLLIADEGNNRVIEVDIQTKNIMWQYGSPNDTDTLNAPAFASRLPNGNTLISDSNNNRILEVSQEKKIVWSYNTSSRAGSVSAPAPTRAVRLSNGNTLISDQFNHQVIEVDTSGQIVWSFGVIGVSGNDSTHLNAPYDAKVIGDYTGLASVGHSRPILRSIPCS